MRDPEREVETLREKIETGERGGAEDAREALLAFSDQMLLMRSTYGWYRHAKLLRHCCRIEEETSRLADALTDKEATEEIVRWIHKEYPIDETPETNQNYRVALRIFGKRVEPTEDGDPPSSIDWISSMLPKDYNPAPDPADMLEWQTDIKPMLDGCRNPRDRAVIALQFDAGLRSFELQGVRLGDVTDGQHGLRVKVDGKTGERSVDLIPSAGEVEGWLARHPTPNDPDAPLWSKLHEPEPLSYRAFLDIFKRAAKRAGVDKPVTPTNFRKSNLAWLAKRGLNARYIEKRQGRRPGSKAVARYCAIFDEDVGDAYAEVLGLEVSETTEADVEPPIRCPRCTHTTPAYAPLCLHCGQSLSATADETATAQNTRMIEHVAQHPELAEAIANIQSAAGDVPGVRVVFELD